MNLTQHYERSKTETVYVRQGYTHKLPKKTPTKTRTMLEVRTLLPVVEGIVTGKKGL